jgi:mono/diheme cytochrome c family protein
MKILSVVHKRMIIGACIVAAAASLAGAAFAQSQMMGMPGLDASKPLPSGPAAGAPKADQGDAVPPTFTAAQVARGQSAYNSNCAECHGPNLNDGEFGGAPLNGSYFHDHWGDLTVDSLYGFMQGAMPPNQPGKLSDQTYADITAFLLDKNGYQSGSQELPANLDALGHMSLAR